MNIIQPQSRLFRPPGQALMEYALLLVLVAVGVIVVIRLLGGSTSGVYCQVVIGLGTEPPTVCETDTVVITRARYDSDDQELQLRATSNGGYNPEAVLTASPGGVMEPRSDHYRLTFTLTGCPCAVTVTSSKGGSASVTVGP